MKPKDLEPLVRYLKIGTIERDAGFYRNFLHSRFYRGRTHKVPDLTPSQCEALRVVLIDIRDKIERVI
ncbi:MAG: hypothetical protein GY804_09655 [Alphaproteobacteria bacterium]|nr:hypothetical protein [Alphaproteobacteria bacterium]